MVFAEEGIEVWDDIFEVMVIQCITLQFLNNVFVQSHNYLAQDKSPSQENPSNMRSDICRPQF